MSRTEDSDDDFRRKGKVGNEEEREESKERRERKGKERKA